MSASTIRWVGLDVIKWNIIRAWARRNGVSYDISQDFNEKLQRKIFRIGMTLENWTLLANHPAGRKLIAKGETEYN
jgi:hypothetical protein